MMDLGKVATDDLIAELERRFRESPGSWTGYQARRMAELAEKLNPPPIQ
jgi:hypothetical protein